MDFWEVKVKGQGQGHAKREKHIIGHNFGSNWHRDFMLSSWDSTSRGPSYVTLTVTFDLDLEMFGQGQSFEKKTNFFQPSRVVYQVKGLGPLIPEV